MKFTPHPYQSQAIQFLIANPKGAIFADPGLGKTTIALSTARIFKRLFPQYRALIITPLIVAHNTWPEEINKWDRFKLFRDDFSILHGPKKNEKIADSSSIHIVNPEGLKWFFRELRNHHKKFPYHHLFVDESTMFKNSNAKRTDLLCKFAPFFKRRTILTGTPIPNSLLDIYSQMKILDNGKTLGKTIYSFRNTYFKKHGYGGYQWKPKSPEVQPYIEKKIAPLVMRIDAKDHLDLPPLIINPVVINLPKEARRVYDSVEKLLFAELDDQQITLPTEASKYNACRQIAGGGLYEPLDYCDLPKDRKAWNLHTAKADMLRAIQNELRGGQVLVGYHYKFVLNHLNDFFGTNIPYIGGGVDKQRAKTLISRWNISKLPMLLGHGQSMRFGLNMQKGKGFDVVWFNIPDNFETFTQFNKRIHRQGVKGTVRVHMLIAKDTIEEVIAKRLQQKEARQASLLDALKAYREGKA